MPMDVLVRATSVRKRIEILELVTRIGVYAGLRLAQGPSRLTFRGGPLTSGEPISTRALGGRSRRVPFRSIS